MNVDMLSMIQEAYSSIWVMGAFSLSPSKHWRAADRDTDSSFMYWIACAGARSFSSYFKAKSVKDFGTFWIVSMAAFTRWASTF